MMRPQWSREIAQILNSSQMRDRVTTDGIGASRQFLAAAEVVDSADQLPEPWRALAFSVLRP